MTQPDPLARAPSSVSGGGYAKFGNDAGASEIRIALREFECIGASPPHDHPHIYLDMGEDDSILCPYCATRFRFDAGLNSGEADPSDASAHV